MADFSQVMALHRAQYPHMEPQDWVKLAYQSAMGPEHALEEQPAVLHRLMLETTLLERAPERAFDPVGNGLVRLHLHPRFTREMLALLARLFARTAQNRAPDPARLADNLGRLAQIGHPHMEEYLARYREAGCPAVHHSNLFRDTYHPHYRLLEREFGVYFPVLCRVNGLAQQGETKVVAIDGPCGSGKTRLAHTITQVFPAPVLHADDFYLPPERRRPDWEDLPAGNMDLARLGGLLARLKAGENVSYRPYSCATGALGPTRTAESGGLVLVEGSYCQHPDLAPLYDLKLFLTCDSVQQRRRLEAREGAGIDAYLTRWMPLERRYHQSCSVAEHSDLVWDTTRFFLS